MRGVGDDCAVVRAAPGMDVSITTDMLLEGRHFLPGADPEALGHKALAVNLSDLAASGASPRWCTLAIGLVQADESWIERFTQGFFALAAEHGVDLVGGDTTRSSVLTLCVTAFGEVPSGAALTRGGARPGDDLWVSGELGGAALGLVHPELAEAAARLHRPQPRVALGRRLVGVASACIDVSDGLASDIGHILERSGVAAEVEYQRVPAASAFERLDNPALQKDCVLSGGDDYELAFTAPQSRRAHLDALARELSLRLTRIGTIVAGAPTLAVRDAAGEKVEYKPGYDHFGAP